MSMISLVFRPFGRKRKIGTLEEKGNGTGEIASFGAESPTKVPPDVFNLFRRLVANAGVQNGLGSEDDFRSEAPVPNGDGFAKTHLFWASLAHLI